MLASLVYVACLLILPTGQAAEGFCNFSDGVFTFEKYLSDGTSRSFMKADKFCTQENNKEPVTIAGKVFKNHMIVVRCK